MAYAKNYIDSLITSRKAVIKLCRMQVYRWWLLIFHPTYIRMICYYQFGMQNQLLLLTPQDQDSQMIQQWQSRYPNVFRTARFIPAVEYLTACRLRYMVMQQAPLLSEYDIIIVPSMAEEPMALTPHRQSCITLPAGIAVLLLRQALHRW
jgi:hypothetical protein